MAHLLIRTRWAQHPTALITVKESIIAIYSSPGVIEISSPKGQQHIGFEAKYIDHAYSGKHAVVLTADGSVLLLDCTARSFSLHKHNFSGAATGIFFDGKKVVVVSVEDSSPRCYVWEDFSLLASAPTIISLSSDSSTILAINNKISQIIRSDYFLAFNIHPFGVMWQLWDLTTGTVLVQANSKSESRTTNLASYSEDSKILVTITGETMTIWDFKKLHSSEESRTVNLKPGPQMEWCKEVLLEKEITHLYSDSNIIILGDYRGSLSLYYPNGNNCEKLVHYNSQGSFGLKDLNNITQLMKKRTVLIRRFGRYIIRACADGSVNLLDIFSLRSTPIATLSFIDGFATSMTLGEGMKPLLLVVQQGSGGGAALYSWDLINSDTFDVFANSSLARADPFALLVHTLSGLGGVNTTRVGRHRLALLVDSLKEITNTFSYLVFETPLLAIANIVLEIDKLKLNFHHHKTSVSDFFKKSGYNNSLARRIEKLTLQISLFRAVLVHAHLSHTYINESSRVVSLQQIRARRRHTRACSSHSGNISETITPLSNFLLSFRDTKSTSNLFFDFMDDDDTQNAQLKGLKDSADSEDAIRQVSSFPNSVNSSPSQSPSPNPTRFSISNFDGSVAVAAHKRELALSEFQLTQKSRTIEPIKFNPAKQIIFDSYMKFALTLISKESQSPIQFSDLYSRQSQRMGSHTPNPLGPHDHVAELSPSLMPIKPNIGLESHRKTLNLDRFRLRKKKSPPKECRPIENVDGIVLPQINSTSKRSSYISPSRNSTLPGHVVLPTTGVNASSRERTRSHRSRSVGSAGDPEEVFKANDKTAQKQ